MPVDRKPIFTAVQALRGGTAWTQAAVDTLDHAIDEATGEKTPRFAPPPAPVPTSVAPTVVTGFVLGAESRAKLADLKPELRKCVELAIRYTFVDFRVNEVLRTVEDQKAAVASGNSRTMKSKHLRQPDGFVWATDLVALKNGVVSWDFELYAAIAAAMDRAATELGCAGHVRWGCAWDRVLSDFGGNAAVYLAEAKAYAARHPGSDLLDGPHFEWVA